MSLPLFPLLAALISGLCFAGLQISFKRTITILPATPHNFLLLPSWLGFLFPFWLLLFASSYSISPQLYNLSASTLIWPLCWAICTVCSTTGLVWLLRNYSLSELIGYKKALITLGAGFIDVFLFNTPLPLFTLLAILFLLSGALNLSLSRQRFPSKKEAIVIVGWCTIMLAQVTFYKTGVLMQPHVLSHTILAQGMSTSLYSLLWLLPSTRQQQRPPLRFVLPILVFALSGVLLEGFAYAQLPLALVLVLTMLPAALMTAHDLYRGDLPVTRRSILGLIGLILGFICLIVLPS